MSIAEEIRKTQDMDGMLRRALERIIQLYADKVHFVYELLQNAEDAKAKHIKFLQYDDRLEVLHDGKPFTNNNLKSLFNIGLSDKVNDLNQIGEFGVGFKSVFSICERVELYSKPGNYREKDVGDAKEFALEIIDFVNPNDIPLCSIEKGYTTKFVFPYAAGLSFSGYSSLKELRDKLTNKLENLNATTLLFMKSLESIEFYIQLSSYKNCGTYRLSKEIINDHCVKVRTLSHNGNDGINYLVFSRKSDVFRSDRSIDIAFAFREKEGYWEFVPTSNPYISVFFPTETESKLDFIVQGPYRTTPNRGSVPFEDNDNIKLAEETAKLLYDSLQELRDLCKLNLSLLSILPMEESLFYESIILGNSRKQRSVTLKKINIYAPVYNATKNFLLSEAALPCRNGHYAKSKQVKLVRSKEIADLINDVDLTLLINDGSEYCWLSEVITQDKYPELYKYLNSTLSIGVITPENLGSLIENNSAFLSSKTDDLTWLKRFYLFLAKNPALFDRDKFGSGVMLQVKFVKSSTGEFIAPYRRDSNFGYQPNIFILPKDCDDDILSDDDMMFVDSDIFAECSDFFIRVLGLQQPREYDLWIRGFKERYKNEYTGTDEKHITDIKKALHYLRSSDYVGDIEPILRDLLVLRCFCNGELLWCNPYRVICYFPKTRDGLFLTEYFDQITEKTYVDFEFYSESGINYEDLLDLNVGESILSDFRRWGEIYTGNPGKQPEWNTYEQTFLWKLDIIDVDDVLSFIESYPDKPNSIIKSKTIFQILQLNEDKLSGTVYRGGNYSAISPAYSTIVEKLRTKKWLFSNMMQLVAPSEISKHQLDPNIYGSIKYDSKLYDYLEFKKTDIDAHEEMVREYNRLSSEKQETYLEYALQTRFGITLSKLESMMSNDESPKAEIEEYEFPIERVRDWRVLRRHAEEMLCYAAPVEYEKVTRQIRISKNGSDAKAYVKHMYRADGDGRCFCQMCHNCVDDIVACQIEAKKSSKFELEPLHLCLCPSCAAKFAKHRNDNSGYKIFFDLLGNLTRERISSQDTIILKIGNGEDELWFTQVHIAEIVELINLQKDAERIKEELDRKDVEISQTITRDKTKVQQEQASCIAQSNSPKPLHQEKIRLTKEILKVSIGKDIRHKKLGIGKIVACDENEVIIDFYEGNKKGQQLKLSISGEYDCLKNDLLEFID